ncbi:MAG: hypothetical protein ACREF4_06215 [Gammaproteobacteria bacterium]
MAGNTLGGGGGGGLDAVGWEALRVGVLEKRGCGWLEYHIEPVTLHSGARSHWLVRSDLIFADEELREAVLQRWRQLLPGDADLVAVPTGGVVWAEAFCERFSSCDYKLYPFTPAVAHPLWPGGGRLFAVVDDVATTGASLGQLPHAQRRLVVVDRTLEAPEKEILSWARIPLPVL